MSTYYLDVIDGKLWDFFIQTQNVSLAKFSSNFKNSLETPKCKNLFSCSQNKRSKYKDQSTKIRVVVQYYQK